MSRRSAFGQWIALENWTGACHPVSGPAPRGGPAGGPGGPAAPSGRAGGGPPSARWCGLREERVQGVGVAAGSAGGASAAGSGSAGVLPVRASSKAAT